MPCPPRHVDYASEMLATNAVTLHGMANPACPGVHAFRCGDHWHVGHRSKAHGRTCRSNPRPPLRRDRGQG